MDVYEPFDELHHLGIIVRRGDGVAMYVQKCIKGVNGITRDRATEIMQDEGLTCNWWRERVKTPGAGVGIQEIGERLTHSNLYLHVNSYGAQHPDFAGLVYMETPFISLRAGNVTAPVFSRTHTAVPLVGDVRFRRSAQRLARLT